MANMAKFLRDVVAQNMNNFTSMFTEDLHHAAIGRQISSIFIFFKVIPHPDFDETESNKLSEVYKAGKKVWMGDYFEEDKDGGNLWRQISSIFIFFKVIPHPDFLACFVHLGKLVRFSPKQARKSGWGITLKKIKMEEICLPMAA
jgi:microcystin degradation protein MlrC